MKYYPLTHTLHFDDGALFAQLHPSVPTEMAYEVADALTDLLKKRSDQVKADLRRNEAKRISP